jgi:hypothetical protein
MHMAGGEGRPTPQAVYKALAALAVEHREEPKQSRKIPYREAAP